MGLLGKHRAKLAISSKCRFFCSIDTGAFVPKHKRWMEARQGRELLREGASNQELDARTSRQQEGLQVFDSFDRESFNQRFEIGLIARLGRERRWEEALQVFESVESPSKVLHATAADACAKSLKESFARRIFDDMPSKTLPAYNSIINLYGRLGRLGEVVSLLCDMRSACLTPNVTTYSSLITAHGSVGDLDSAMQAFEDMIDVGISPNSVSYMAIITACAKAGDQARALQMLVQMKSVGIEPNIAHFTGVISSCAFSGDEKRASAVFFELRRSKIKPDVVAYTSLMTCLQGPSALKKVEDVLAEMRTDGVKPNATTYSELLRAARDSGATQRFQELIMEMQREGIPQTQKVQMQVRQMLQQQSSLQPSLPQGWQEAMDPVSCQPYYWRESDPHGSVTWQRPV